MAQEAKRGCGYRVVGGMYLCGDYIAVPCDRLPYLLEVCPVCGGGIKVSRGFTEIDPLQLFGYHQPCTDQHPDCYMCSPTHELGFIMRVGDKFYTPESFSEEAQRLGVSKRIPFIPKKLQLGKTVVYLAHPKACVVKSEPAMQLANGVLCTEGLPQSGAFSNQSVNSAVATLAPPLLDAEQEEPKMGIFSAFIPQRVEKLIWKSQATKKELEKLKKRGITPVVIEDDDPDHAPSTVK